MITRRVFQPKDIHLLVARRLAAEGLWSDGLVAWRSARDQAERRVHGRAAGEEITLEAIEAELQATVGGQLAARAVALELEIELSSCTGIASTIAAMRQLISAGEHVVYASDMYLPRVQVLAMLEKAGAPTAPLYLSSEIDKTKRSGSLFRYMAEQNGVSLRDISHTGDHPESDGRVPRRMGLRTRLFNEGRPTLLESEIHRRLEGSSPLLASTWAGGMRAARLALPPQVLPHRVLPHRVLPHRVLPHRVDSQALLLRLGTQEAALVHVAFVLWLLPRLREWHPNQIAFLARDGCLSAKIFDVLRSSLSTDLPASSYTYASRQSLHLAGLSIPLQEEDLAWILAPANSLTFEGWLFRLALTIDDLAGLRSSVAIPPPDTDFAACKEQCVHLLAMPEFLGLMAGKARAARLMACDYLKPRILPDSGRTAIVDIGWNGRMQRSIVSILDPSAAQVEAVHGFYLGILRVPPGDYGGYTAWLFDLRTEPRPYCASHFQLFETLFAAPHATTYGYEREPDGAVVPRLAAQDAMRDLWPALSGLHEVIVDIARGIRADWNELREAEQTVRALCRQSLAALFRAPSRAQAMAFFDVGFSSDQTSVGKERLVVRLSWSQQYRFMFDKRRRFSGNHWTEGQMAIADAPLLRPTYQILSSLRMLVKKQIGWKELLRKVRWHLKGHGI